MMQKIMIWAMLTGVFICLRGEAYGQTEKAIGWEQVREARAAGDYQSVVSMVRSLDIRPDDSLRYYKALLNAYFRLGNYPAVKQNAHAALRIDPRDRTVLNQLGALYDAEQNLPKAIKYYSRLLQTDTMNAYYHRQNGFVHLKAGFRVDAFRHFARAYKLNPGDVVVVTALADLLMESEEFRQADSILQLAYTADTSNVRVLLAQARSGYQQKNYADAVERLEKVNRQIDVPEYYIKMLGYAYLQIDSADQAIYWLERLVHSDQREFVHYYLAVAYELKGDHSASLFHYDKAISKSISEKIDHYYAEAAGVYKEQGNLRKAIEYYRKALDYNGLPGYLYELGVLSDTYYKDKAIALRYFRKYLQSGDDQPAFMDYARKRARYLQELLHFKEVTN